MRNTSFKQLILVTVIVTLTFTCGTGMYFSCIYRMTGYFAPETADLFAECICYVAQAVGMFLTAVLVRLKVRFTGGRFFFPVIAVLTVLSGIPAFLTEDGALVAAVFVISSVLEGVSQGLYFLLIVTAVPKDKRLWAFGISYTVSPIITALLALIGEGAFVKSGYALILYFVMAAAACILWQFVVPVYPAREVKPVSTIRLDKGGMNPVLIATFFFIAVTWAVQSVAFYFPIAQMDELEMSGELLRITYSLGLISATWINNRDKRIGSICCLVTMTAPMLYILLQTKVGVTTIVFFICYFMTGFLAVYRFGIVADLSDMVSDKGLPLIYLCSFGIIFGRLGEAAGAYIGISLTSDPLALMAVTSVLLVFGSGVFMFHYIKLFSPVPKSEMTRDDVLASIKLTYDLSSREMDVLNLLVDGATNTEIAGKLFISENTVKFHVSNLLKKTNAKSRKELSSLFLEQLTNK